MILSKGLTLWPLKPISWHMTLVLRPLNSSHTCTCYAVDRYWRTLLYLCPSGTKIDFSLWSLVDRTCLDPTLARSMNGKETLTKKMSNSLPESLMKETKGISPKRNPLLRNPVLLVLLWLDCLDRSPKTPIHRSLGSPFGDSPNHLHIRPALETSLGLRPTLETDQMSPPLPTGTTPETRAKEDKKRTLKDLLPTVPSTGKVAGEAADKAGNRTGQLPVGGKLVHFTKTWTQHFPQHYEIVRKVSQGILIAFDDVPPPLLRHPLELPSNNKAADLQHAVQKLCLSQAIEEVVDTTSPGYYSRLFLVPKPDGSFRPIIDLKKLNQFIIVPSFKMETLFSIIAALQPNEWITKIDLKDAYHHILVHVNIRKYFRFVVAGTVYQFRVLPFGLSTAPREFTKTLAPVVHLLRSQGIQVYAYLDDWIIRASSKELSLLHTQQVLQLLQSLGWTNLCYSPPAFWTFWASTSI